MENYLPERTTNSHQDISRQDVYFIDRALSKLNFLFYLNSRRNLVNWKLKNKSQYTLTNDSLK